MKPSEEKPLLNGAAMRILTDKIESLAEDVKDCVASTVRVEDLSRRVSKTEDRIDAMPQSLKETAEHIKNNLGQTAQDIKWIADQRHQEYKDQHKDNQNRLFKLEKGQNRILTVITAIGIAALIVETLSKLGVLHAF